MKAFTISSTFQIAVPKQVRERLQLQPGQKLTFIQRVWECLLVAVPTKEALLGIAKGANAENYRD
jgi:AbrB family looped-hinge helix DNA binding protein